MINLIRPVLSGLLALAVVVGSAVAQAASLPQVPGQPFEVAAAQKGFAVDSDRVLYHNGASELVLHDLRTGDTRTIATEHPVKAVALTGQHAAYAALTAEGEISLFLYDLQTGQLSLVARDQRIEHLQAARGKLVWQQADQTFFLYDIASAKLRPLQRISVETTNEGWVKPVRFDGTFLVWTEGGEVRNVDTRTGENYRRWSVNSLKYTADVFNGKIIYVSSGHDGCRGGDDIFVYNPGVYTDQSIAHLNCQDPAPDLYGNLVTAVTRNDADGTSAIRLVDISVEGPGRSRTLVNDTAVKGDPRLTDRYVVYPIYAGGQVRLLAAPLNAVGQPGEATQPVFYTVKPGDTLWRIAQAYKIVLPDLVQANNLVRPDAVNVGDVLFLPYPASPRQERYTVKAGDTLTRIAIQHKTTVASLVRLNKLSSRDLLYVGQVLNVTRGPEQLGDEEWLHHSYVVMPGDTLWTISQRAGVSMASLIEANQLKNPNALNVATQLVIRAKAWPRF